MFWLNQDPIGELGGLNLYRFVANAPTVRFDPFGLQYWDKAGCDSLKKEIESMEKMLKQPGMDQISVLEQLKELQELFDENCSDGGGGNRGLPNDCPVVVPGGGRRIPAPAPQPSFCEKHPVICGTGLVVGGVALGALAVATFGTGPVLATAGAAAIAAVAGGGTSY